MKVFLWRHNRRYHSWSMMNEPVVHHACYTDAVLVVQADSEEEAYALIAKQEPAWLVEELKRLRPRVFEAPAVVFADVRGD